MTLDWHDGFLLDIDTGLIATTTDTAGAFYLGGFLRAPSGALVVSYV